ncbi:hypothetical protein DFJ74DRAFT_706281 [Hyaloraphidium curvatum]|nr:hypothetical protein DFJ74DRAFT_706281 [Hyaloraphidium curvatum]
MRRRTLLAYAVLPALALPALYLWLLSGPGPPLPPAGAVLGVRTRNWAPVHGAGWTLVAASLDVLSPGGSATGRPGSAAVFVELAFFLVAGEPRLSQKVILISDAFSTAPKFALGEKGALGAGTAVAVQPHTRDLARLLCPLTAANLHSLRGFVGRSLAVEIADGAGFRAAFELDVVALDPSAGAGKVVICTQALWNRSALENHIPDATRFWLEHHFSNGAADAAVMYDVDGSFAPTAAALVAAGRDVRYFPRWHGMPVSSPRDTTQQTAALHHCLAVARESAEWALHIDPDEYVVCRSGFPLAGYLDAPDEPDEVVLDRALFTHLGGPSPVSARFPDLCWKAPKAYFRTRTSSAPDVHRLRGLRASTSRHTPYAVRADPNAARINHYMSMVRQRNRTDCVDTGKPRGGTDALPYVAGIRGSTALALPGLCLWLLSRAGLAPPPAAALISAGHDVTYFPRWHGMPVPEPPRTKQQVPALHHCLALARERADWALHIDPDESQPHEGPGLPTTRYPELSSKIPKAIFRTSTAASPDVHRLLALRESAGRRPRTIRADATRARINHYNDLSGFRNRTDCVASGGKMNLVPDDPTSVAVTP